MDFTGPSIWKGLAGFHLHHDAIENRLRLPVGNHDLPLMIADCSFAADGSLHYPGLDQSLHMLPGVESKYMAGVLGDVILVNGAPWPVVQVSGNLYRLRLLNTSNARRYRLALDPPSPGGKGLIQTGSDVGLLATPIEHDAIEIAPAERFNVLIDLSRYAPGSKVTLANEFGSGSTSKVMQFAIGTRGPETATIPDTLADVPTLARYDATTTRTLQFRQGYVGKMRCWTINDEPFSPDQRTCHRAGRHGDPAPDGRLSPPDPHPSQPVPGTLPRVEWTGRRSSSRSRTCLANTSSIATISSTKTWR